MLTEYIKMINKYFKSPFHFAIKLFISTAYFYMLYKALCIIILLVG